MARIALRVRFRAKHLHLACHDLDGASFLAVFVDVLADRESAIDEDRRAPLKILITDFAEPIQAMMSG